MGRIGPIRPIGPLTYWSFSMFLPMSRRTALQTAACGFGYLAFADLATRAAEKEVPKGPLAPKSSHFPAKAKHVIFLCMEGAPSHVDTFDYKPKLTTDDGKPFSGSRFGGGKLLASPWKFGKSGKSGIWISGLYPYLANPPARPSLFHSIH